MEILQFRAISALFHFVNCCIQRNYVLLFKNNFLAAKIRDLLIIREVKATRPG